MKRITESQFYDLLSLKLSGDATPEELMLLQEQLSIHPEWQFIYDQLLQSPVTTVNEDELAELAYASHITKMQIKGHFSETSQTENQQKVVSTNKTKVFRLFNYAAGVAACFITFFLIYVTIQNRKAISEVAHNEVSTKKGSKSNIKLPDGTQVWLNADSKLTYSNDFANNREVVLVGEAYFDVTHDATHPFVIHTGNANIKVLGTAFNVRNYPLDKTLETTLMRGKIEVSFNDRIGDKIIMKPLEKLILHKGEPNKENTQKSQSLVELTTVSYTKADSSIAETSWVNDKMVFINEPLENIAIELEQHYAIKIIFKNDDVKKFRYTGVFGNVSIEKVLLIFQLSKKINFKTEGDVITIY